MRRSVWYNILEYGGIDIILKNTVNSEILARILFSRIGL